MRHLPIASLALFLVGCAVEEEAATGPVESALSISERTPTTVAGSFTYGDSVVAFEAASADQQFATLHVDVNGLALDAELTVTGLLTEDGNHGELGATEQAALIGLRDALNAEQPELVTTTFEGTFLSRHIDWIADAPVGYRFGYRVVDASDRFAQRTTNDDDKDTTCLWPGGGYYAYYDQGNGGTQWMWYRIANSGSCIGRCGAGCNWFDDDIMLDCFEHDSCVDHLGGSTGGGNANCGDEYDHAVAEYIVTYAAWCPY